MRAPADIRLPSLARRSGRAGPAEARTRLVFLPPGADGLPWMLTFGGGGEVLERGSLQAGQPPAVATRDVLVVPGVEVAVHWLPLPARNPVQARAAARLMLEERIARPDEDVHAAVGPAEADEHRLVAAVGRQTLQGWLETARRFGVEPALAIPDNLLLPEPDGEEVLGVDMGSWLALRGRRLALSCEPEMLEVLLPGREVRLASSSEALEQLWARAVAAPAVDLQQGLGAGADSRPVEGRDLRRLAALAAGIALAPALILGIDSWRYDSAARHAETAAAAEVNAVLPRGRPIGDPLAQARSRLDSLDLAAGNGPVGAAASLFAAVEAIEGAQIESLIVGQEGVRAAVSHGGGPSVESLAQSMRKAGFAFKEEAAREDGGRVMSDVLVGNRS
ncbi:MAG: type II secretion system protein GspL [Phenylobacterium sp.]